MFETPTVGSKIRVTTRHRNHYYLTAESEPFEDFVYEGIVLPSSKNDHPYTFNMTGIKDFPERNISLQFVVDLKYLNGTAAKKLQKDLQVRAFKVESQGRTYVVTKAAAKYTCTCVGFQYRKRCKHVDGVHKKVG